MSGPKVRYIAPKSIDFEPSTDARQDDTASEIKRQNADGSCGPGVGSCVSTQCCSPAGWCGKGPEYCAGPDCQYQYGPACDANHVPTGPSTANIPRPKAGIIPYGGDGVYDCQLAGGAFSSSFIFVPETKSKLTSSLQDIALTFDDGPYDYTSDLLDKLQVYGAKATFMITGNNLGKGPIDSTPKWASLIKRMVAEGHQIASHTWTHQNLSALDIATFHNQLIYNEMAIRNILGFFPAYMRKVYLHPRHLFKAECKEPRPPYSECNATCSNILGDLGYHVTYFDLDTQGYLNDDPIHIQNSKTIWNNALNQSNHNTDTFLEIEHDIHYQSVYNLTEYILASTYAHGYRAVTVGQCLGDPPENWYRQDYRV